MGLFSKLFGKTNKPVETKKDEELHIDLTKVFPRIKGLYNDDTTGPGSDSNTVKFSDDDLPIIEPIAKELGLFYGVDMGHTFMILQNKHLSATLTLETLRESAIKNLREETSNTTQIEGNTDDIMMLTNGGNYETAMILLDSVWMQMEELFNDQICIALPARDLLFIAGKNNPAGREHLREMVNNAYSKLDDNWLLVRHIYTYEDNKWVVLETV